MPITRRRRANPPEQPENTNQNPAEQAENAAEAVETPATEQTSEKKSAPAENGTGGASGEVNYPPYQQAAPNQSTGVVPPFNGEHRSEFRGDRPEYPPAMESTPPPVTRRPTFRRPPLSSANALNGPTQPAIPQTPPPAPVVTPPALPTPTHEINLPLGNLLHLAYNPSYTGSDEARKTLLQKLAQESKAGGRARCWSCGSLAIVYDNWNTRSKNFGEVGVAFCEICGVWSVM
ncbi:hypothetical protein KSD_13480 [Ktedonobacter sp. SOSP1-85]|uniref:hypothetical protein n=1 Tax=Ktedonobacter sp. SOSP1-85 TaxID=2778367 RepID=UPI0019158B5B|nr:hypothetical protein [Ktedonobacter sp. SOSP1-85]GHO73577.1 hypothetical protein KSD_13480 [Ktedonobacter sp. SOSP1-85]